MKTNKDIFLEDIVIVKPNIRTRGNSINAQVTIPAAIIRRYGIKHKEEIIIAFLGKVDKKRTTEVTDND